MISTSTRPCLRRAATSSISSSAIQTLGSHRAGAAQLVGDQIRRLVDGEAALAFKGSGELVLEARIGHEPAAAAPAAAAPSDAEHDRLIG